MKWIIHKESNIKTNEDLIELPDKDNLKSVIFLYDRRDQTQGEGAQKRETGSKKAWH